jgi:nucleotide-binding universal stress UspA family protein
VLDDANAKTKSKAMRLLDECRVVAKEQVGLDIETVIMEGSNLGESIIDFCERDNFDLIVMGANGHSKLKDIVLGGTPHKVVHRSKCSVLVVR